MWKRVNLGVFARIPVNAAETSEGVLTINVHGTRAANTLSARAPERQRRVNLVLDLDERIQYLYGRAYGSEYVRLRDGKVGGHVPWDRFG